MKSTIALLPFFTIRQKSYDLYPPYLRLQSHLVTWGNPKVRKVSIYYSVMFFKVNIYSHDSIIGLFKVRSSCKSFFLHLGKVFDAIVQKIFENVRVRHSTFE